MVSNGPIPLYGSVTVLVCVWDKDFATRKHVMFFDYVNSLVIFPYSSCVI